MDDGRIPVQEDHRVGRRLMAAGYDALDDEVERDLVAGRRQYGKRNTHPCPTDRTMQVAHEQMLDVRAALEDRRETITVAQPVDVHPLEANRKRMVMDEQVHGPIAGTIEPGLVKA